MAHKRAASDSDLPLKPRQRPRLQPNFEIAHLLDPSPACPGVVKKHNDLPLSKLLTGTKAFASFAKSRADKSITNKEAFFDLLANYDIPLSTSSALSTSFSNAEYAEVAPYVFLSPDRHGHDIQQLEVFRSRIPKAMFYEIVLDVDDALTQYGSLDLHDTEEARSRFISSLFNKIVCLFGNTVVNKPEGLLERESNVIQKGRIKHHFVALGSISVVFIKVKKEFTMGKDRLDTIGQVLAEAAAGDSMNAKYGLWVPVLGILCDGLSFKFFVYDSADKYMYSSHWIQDLPLQVYRNEPSFLVSLKITTEYLFDWFLMVFTNGMRASGERPLRHSRVEFSTEKWQNTLALAEKARWALRQAAVAATPAVKDYGEAERLAEQGVQMLKQRFIILCTLKSPSINEFG